MKVLTRIVNVGALVWLTACSGVHPVPVSVHVTPRPLVDAYQYVRESAKAWKRDLFWTTKALEFVSKLSSSCHPATGPRLRRLQALCHEVEVDSPLVQWGIEEAEKLLRPLEVEAKGHAGPNAAAPSEEYIERVDDCEALIKRA